jgi:hypothetical protein
MKTLNLNNIDTVNKSRETLTKYMLLSHDLNSDENQDMNIANKLFENVAQFKYLELQ